MNRVAAILLAALLLPAVLHAQVQSPEAKAARRLLMAKMIYVAPMPDDLSGWIIQDLKAWGRYQVSPTAEGVDLVMRAQTPNNRALEKPRGIMPGIRRPKVPLQVLSITVSDWVTKARVWRADILNEKPKHGGAPAAGPRAEIYARHMKPAEIAERVTNALRAYVAQVQQGAAAK